MRGQGVRRGSWIPPAARPWCAVRRRRRPPRRHPAARCAPWRDVEVGPSGLHPQAVPARPIPGADRGVPDRQRAIDAGGRRAGPAAGVGGFQSAVKSDAFLVQTVSDAVSLRHTGNLAATVSRGTGGAGKDHGSCALGGRSVTPSVELGVGRGPEPRADGRRDAQPAGGAPGQPLLVVRHIKTCG